MKDFSIQSKIANIMKKYDHNRDGVIDRQKPEGIFGQMKNPDETWGYDGSTTYSMDTLFIAADKDNDKKATPEEIENVVKEYDKNKDGKLSYRGFWEMLTGKPKGEGETFDQDYPETDPR